MRPSEKVASMDMTFCVHKDCKNRWCDRHQCHKIEPWFFPVSVADFKDTEECEVRRNEGC